MTAWIQSAVLALFVNSVSSVTYTPSQVVEFAKCHELQTKHFLMEGGVGTANPAPCTAPTPLQTLWASYKNLLDSADSTNAADLQQVSISYKEMTEALKPFLRELPLQTAEIQTYLLSKMAALTETLLVQAVFSLSNVNRSSYALALTLSLDLWKAAYESVTEGDLLRGVPELTEQCTMRYMLALKHQWEPFHSKMIDVVDEKPDKTIQMLPKSDDMQDLLQKAIASLTGGSCTPQAISSKQWFYALKRLNYVRKNIHKSAYHMFELEMLYRLGQSGEPTDETTTTLLQDHVRHELSDAAGGLEESLRGTEKLPVAPTQEIVDALLVVRTQFDALKATIEKTLKEHAHSTEIFENIEHSSSDIDKGIDALSLLYLFEAVASGVAPGIANMYFASRQSVFLVELVREALWLFLCQNYSGKDTSKFDYFVNAFESVHKALLEGGKEKYSGIILPHSTDHCVLTQMAYVKQDFGDLRNTMVQLFSYEDFQILQKGYVRAEASTAFLVQAMKDFKAAWVSFRSTDTMRSRDLLVAYHFSNPNAAGSKDKLNSASGPEAYHSVHRKYHPEYRAILYSRNYYDIFFFDLQGNCIYSVFKELDFATNFAATGSGPYRSSGLGEAYQAALAAPEEIHVTPWAPYDPSKGALASFICTGVRDGSELIGVFCTQMPAETRPITVAEMETALDRASKSMDLATSYKVYHPGCTSTISQTAWEQLIAKMSLVEVDSYRIQTEFQLLNAGYSQLWLDQADQGREEQKAKVAASVTTELGDAFVEFKAAWDAYRATNEERLLSLQIRYILLNPFPTGQKDKLDSAEGPETYHEVHQKYHPTYRALLYEKNYYEMKNFRERGTMQYIEQKFQAHLQRARAAFLQEFRNHAVVVETEVRKIREEMTEKMEDKYGKMLGELRESVMGTEGLVQAQKAEISQLKGVVAAQETYMTAAKHKEHLEGLNQSLEKQLENARDEIADLKHQLACREEMLRQVTHDVAQTELELNRHRASSEEEKREAEERYQVLHKAMQQQQKQFSEHIQRYSQEFHQYKEKASDQMQILAILNRRLKEALRNMEEERQRFILARSKPTPRIGEEVEEELPEEPVDLDPSPVYRTDDMGMDTAWRDYKISNMELVIPASRPMPRFKVDRVRRAVPSPGTGGTGTPGSRGTPRSRPVPSQLLQLPQVAPELGTVLAPRRDS